MYFYDNNLHIRIFFALFYSLQLQLQLVLIMRLVVLLATLCGVSLAHSRINHRFQDLLVSTKVGQIRGLKDDRGYFKFLGIPYGQVDSNIFGVSYVLFFVFVE